MAGFIGYHIARRLVDRGGEVVGIDNLNRYYDVQLNIDRLRELGLASDDADCLNHGVVGAVLTLRSVRVLREHLCYGANLCGRVRRYAN